MAICRTAKLKYSKDGSVNYSYYHMMDSGDVTSAGYSQKLGVYYDDKIWYVPATSGSASGQICYIKDKATYHCVKVSPTLTMSYTVSTSSVTTSGSTITTWTVKLTQAKINIAINTSIDIYFSNNGGSSYTKAGTLTAGALSVSLSTTMSSQSSSAFRIQLRTSVGLTNKTGTVKWVEESIDAVQIGIKATVTISSSLVKGSIVYRGEYTSTLPPFYSYGESTVFSAGSRTNTVQRKFGSSSLGALTYTTSLYYKSGTSGVGTSKIATRTWVAAPTVPIPITFTDSFSFKDVTGSPQTINTFSPTTSSGSHTTTYAIPETWW